MRSRRSPAKWSMQVYIGDSPALDAATLIGPSGLVFGTDISLPILERAKRNADGLPVKLVAMDGQALACADTSLTL